MIQIGDFWSACSTGFLAGRSFAQQSWPHQLLTSFFSYRFTASVIELLLSEQSVPRHRVLTEFIEKTTGFTLTDAKDLEDKEPPLSKELMKKIRKYGPITSAGALFEQNNGEYYTSIIGIFDPIANRWNYTTIMPNCATVDGGKSSYFCHRP